VAALDWSRLLAGPGADLGEARPPNWTGYRLRPLLIEFWEDRPFRLHDRVEFQRDAFDAPWRKTRLYP
jgi:pyridoxamine 5'-phosphate oxidase